MLECDFPTAGRPGKHRCTRCGQVLRTRNGGRLVARCVGSKKHGDPMACVHRGPQVRAVSVPGCCGAPPQLVPVLACALHGECHLREVKTSDLPKPSALRKTASAAAAAVNWAASGFKILPEANRLERAAVCGPCEANVGGWCTDCGCLLSAKQVLPGEHCPRSLWLGDPPNPSRVPPATCMKCLDRISAYRWAPEMLLHVEASSLPEKLAGAEGSYYLELMPECETLEPGTVHATWLMDELDGHLPIGDAVRVGYVLEPSAPGRLIAEFLRWTGQEPERLAAWELQTQVAYVIGSGELTLGPVVGRGVATVRPTMRTPAA